MNEELKKLIADRDKLRIEVKAHSDYLDKLNVRIVEERAKTNGRKEAAK